MRACKTAQRLAGTGRLEPSDYFIHTTTTTICAGWQRTEPYHCFVVRSDEGNKITEQVGVLQKNKLQQV